MKHFFKRFGPLLIPIAILWITMWFLDGNLPTWVKVATFYTALGCEFVAIVWIVNHIHNYERK